MRNIENYVEKYTKAGFEDYKVLYRRKKILEVIEKYHSKKILEIGCGMEPLFQYVDDAEFTIVEPSEVFCNNVTDLLHDGKYNVKCIQGLFEEVAANLSKDYDLIICSSLLHEVEHPGRFIEAIAQTCCSDTVVHVNVPNANSMHCLLGKELGVLSDIHDMTENNKEFQQNNVFDKCKLEMIVNNYGLEVIESGSFFVKPFSHNQMYEMMQSAIIDEKVLDGLYRLAEYMPEYGSEIYVNCKLK